MSQQLQWPPEYTLRISTRAKSVRVQICPVKGLQLIVPKRFNQKNAISILETHKQWIEKTWTRLQPQIHANKIIELPQTISFPAIKIAWSVYYEPLAVNRVIVNINKKQQQIILRGAVSNQSLVCNALQTAVNQIAKLTLIPWLTQLSVASNLIFSQANTRNTKTLWGSCTAKKKILLNCKLLFLPTEIVEYVLYHELCHLVHMNHSRNFWKLVEKFQPNCHTLRKQLKNSQQHIPGWFLD